MKINVKFLSAAVLTAALVAAPITALAADSTFGSAGAGTDTDYTLAEMLTYAVQDEYAAQAEYNAITEKYGVQRPFSNIVKAEATHISALLPLFGTYKITVPENNAAEIVVVPGTLAESYAVAVDAEMNNIAMYEGLLKEDLPADVAVIFEALQTASENHLVAFERAADGTSQGILNGSGAGAGNQNGTGTMAGNGNKNGSGRGAGNGTGIGNGTGTGAGNGTGIGNGGTGNCIL